MVTLRIDVELCEDKNMAVRIRLRRTGKRNAASHRIVVADARSPRDGRFIENIGTYDPRHKEEIIDLERVDYWVGQGAQPSDTVNAIINRAREGRPLTPPETTEPAPAEKVEEEPVVETAEETAEETAPEAPAEDAENTENTEKAES